MALWIVDIMLASKSNANRQNTLDERGSAALYSVLYEHRCSRCTHIRHLKHLSKLLTACKYCSVTTTEDVITSALHTLVTLLDMKESVSRSVQSCTTARLTYGLYNVYYHPSVTTDFPYHWFYSYIHHFIKSTVPVDRIPL